MLVKVNYSIIHHYQHLIRTYKITISTQHGTVKYKQYTMKNKKKYALKEKTQNIVLWFCGYGDSVGIPTGFSMGVGWV